MKHLLTRFVFALAIPILIFELAIRFFFLPVPEYSRISALGNPGTRRVLFVGKSWIGAAIDASVVSSILTQETQHSYAVENLGYGGATLAMHLLGFKHLLRNDPNALNNSIVVIESARGLPDLYTQKESWINDTPGILIPYLTWRDLPALWSSATPREIKFFNTLASHFRTLELIPGWQQKTQRIMESRFNEALYTLRSQVRPNSSLPESTGIRSVAGLIVDDAAIRHLRAFMQREAESTRSKLPQQQAYESWDKLIVRELVSLIQGAGGDVIFLDIPQSSISRIENTTAIGLCNAGQFQKVLNQWATKLIQVPFATDDEDFPDLSHLSKPKARLFSEVVAREIAKRERQTQKLSLN